MLGLDTRLLLLLPLAVGGMVAAVVLFRAAPRVGVATWLATVGFVPIWIGVDAVTYFSLTSVVGIALVLALRLRVRSSALSVADLVVGFFFLACLAPVLIGGSTASAVFGVLTQWLVGYGIGRLAPGAVTAEWLSAAVACVFSLVALAAIAEFLLDWHPFVGLGPGNGLHTTYGGIRGRGGLWRSEWAFGSSIALGASLCLALPIAVLSRLPLWLRCTSGVLITGGIVVTLSRGALAGAALTLVLMVVFARGAAARQLRAPLVVLGLAGAAAVVPFVSRVLDAAGVEASSSAAYRSSLVSLVTDFTPLGISGAAGRTVVGGRVFAGFESIDNQLLLTGLTYGALPLALGLLALALAGVALLRGRATPAIIAVVAHVPLLASVALITQYSMWFWCVAGMAVAAGAAAPAGSTQERRAPRAPSPSAPPPTRALASGAARSAEPGAIVSPPADITRMRSRRVVR